MNSNWLSKRLKERTSLDGVMLILAGASYLLFGQAIATMVAYAAIAYGIYTFWKSE